VVFFFYDIVDCLLVLIFFGNFGYFYNIVFVVFVVIEVLLLVR